MNLGELVSADRIIAEMEATTHWDAICELVDFLIEHGAFPAKFRESLLEALREREDQCSTGIGGGKAIPHVYSEDVEEVLAVFGRSKEGIEFGAIDNAPVYFVVLLIVPKAQYNLHLKTLAAIARNLSGGDVYRDLTEAKDADEISKILGGKKEEK